MKKQRFTDPQIMQILKQAEGGVPVAELWRSCGGVVPRAWDEQCQLLQVALKIWRYGRVDDVRDEGVVCGKVQELGCCLFRSQIAV